MGSKAKKKICKLFIVMFLFVSLLIVPTFVYAEDEETKVRYIYEVRIDEIARDFDTSAKERHSFVSSDCKVGDTVVFGRYANKDENDIKPIEWVVLEREGDTALLMSKYILENIEYNRRYEKTCWKNSTVRKWLNEEFYNKAFDDWEKTYIEMRLIKNTSNYYCNTDAGEDTIDKVFILSIDEKRKYIDDYKKALTVGTEYAVEDGLWVSRMPTSIGLSVWWLRSPGKNTAHAALVHAAGSIGFEGDEVSIVGNGVRPCIYVITK